MRQTFDHSNGEFLDHDGARLYYEVAGNPTGPALLFLHGGFGHIADFNPVLPAVTEKYKIIGIDSRGHGRSTMDSKNLSYELLQHDVEAVLKHLDIDTLSIIGFSDGGILGYRLAAFTSLNILKLVTIGATWKVDADDSMKELFLSLNGDVMRKRQPAYYEAYQRLNPEPDFDLFIKKLVPMWMDASEAGYPNQDIDRVKCPLLVVRGDNDHLTKLKVLAEIPEHVEGAAFLNIPFAGHTAFVDESEIFNICLKQFLEA